MTQVVYLLREAGFFAATGFAPIAQGKIKVDYRIPGGAKFLV